MARSPYGFYDRRAVTIDPVTAKAPIPSTSTGYVITLLPPTSIEGRIAASVDFVTEWQGNIEYSVLDISGASNGFVEIFLNTHHEFNGKAFDLHRQVEGTVVSQGSNNLFRLSNMNTRAVVPVGTYMPPSGEAIEITEADLNGPTIISYSLEFLHYNRRAGSRLDANINNISLTQGQVTSYQLAVIPEAVTRATGGKDLGITDIQEAFPEITDKTDTEIETAIRLQRGIYTATRQGSLYLAAHFLTVDKDERPAQVAAAGGLRIQYMSMGMDQMRQYETTFYGRAFLALRKAAPASLGFGVASAL